MPSADDKIKEQHSLSVNFRLLERAYMLGQRTEQLGICGMTAGNGLITKKSMNLPFLS